MVCHSLIKAVLYLPGISLVLPGKSLIYFNTKSIELYAITQLSILDLDSLISENMCKGLFDQSGGGHCECVLIVSRKTV